MISRLQQFFFLFLLIACIAMAATILHIRQDAKARLASHANQAIASQAGEEKVYAATVMIPNDMTGQLDPVQLSLALPQDPSRRAQALLNQLLACWEESDSTHPFGTGSLTAPATTAATTTSSTPATNQATSPNIRSVYFVPLLDQPSPDPAHPDPAHKASQENKLLAVVDLNAAFPLAQPSGIEPETLSLRSMVETLYANFPSVAEVRFLVNGEARATLAGHADLERAYDASPSGQ